MVGVVKVSAPVKVGMFNDGMPVGPPALLTTAKVVWTVTVAMMNEILFFMEAILLIRDQVMLRSCTQNVYRTVANEKFTVNDDFGSLRFFENGLSAILTDAV